MTGSILAVDKHGRQVEKVRDHCSLQLRDMLIKLSFGHAFIRRPFRFEHKVSSLSSKLGNNKHLTSSAHVIDSQ